MRIILIKGQDTAARITKLQQEWVEKGFSVITSNDTAYRVGILPTPLPDILITTDTSILINNQVENKMTFTKSDTNPPKTPEYVAFDAPATTGEKAVEAFNKKNETKTDKFKRLAEYRTKRVLKNIRSLAKLSNRAIYDFSDEQLDAIYNAIAKEVDVAVSKFKGTKTSEPEFKL